MENAENSGIQVFAMGSRWTFPRRPGTLEENERYIRGRLAAQVGEGLATMAASWNEDGTSLTFVEATGDKGDEG